MQTDFSPAQRADPAMAAAEAVIRKCVHCGFCNATCPTYALLGDELDSPRGRIYLIKDMLENERQPDAETVKHVDRCLSCLACMTTCPSGVNYMHLVDHARAYIEARHKRPAWERLQRTVVALVLPSPARFRAALHMARLAKPLAPLLARYPALRPLGAMLALAPRQLPRKAGRASASGTKGRVILLQGCAEPVLRPQIRAATQRLLERMGYAVQFAKGEQCCGALVHHMGRDEQARAAARRNVDAWLSAHERDPVSAIIVTASGCGTSIKDYGFLLRDDPAYAERARKISALAKDISEFLATAGLPAVRPDRHLTVAYHPPCSLQHGQKIIAEPQHLLRAANFTVCLPAESHLCCGSAGTYNIFQPDLAGQLGERKAQALAKLAPDVIVTGNIGCMTQIGQHTDLPVLHLVELLDWATGGTEPAAAHPSWRPDNAAKPDMAG